MNYIKNKTILNFILLFSIFTLLAAYFVQYVLGHKPCNLCIIERVPYILTILVITLSFILKGYQKIFIIILLLIFISATLISLYHVGIEQGLIEESFVCNLNSQNINLTAEDPLNELKESKISCKDVCFKILGLSLATINAIFCFVISIILGKLFFNYEKNK